MFVDIDIEEKQEYLQGKVLRICEVCGETKNDFDVEIDICIPCFDIAEDPDCKDLETEEMVQRVLLRHLMIPDWALKNI